MSHVASLVAFRCWYLILCYCIYFTHYLLTDLDIVSPVPSWTSGDWRVVSIWDDRWQSLSRHSSPHAPISSKSSFTVSCHVLFGLPTLSPSAVFWSPFRSQTSCRSACRESQNVTIDRQIIFSVSLPCRVVPLGHRSRHIAENKLIVTSA